MTEDAPTDAGRDDGVRDAAESGDGDAFAPADVREDGVQALAPPAQHEDAFQALAGTPRVRVLEALAAAPDGRLTFTECFEATDVDTSAGFAYHLRQLTGSFVRKVPGTDADPDGEYDGDPGAGGAGTHEAPPDRYELTDAGRRVARAVAAGAYTGSVDRDPVALDDDCPLCGDPDGLHAAVADNVTRVACGACDGDVLALPFPPVGYAARDPDDVPAAVDRHHRRRIGTFADGVCPDCGGPATARLQPVAGDDGVEPPRDDAPTTDDGDPLAVHVRFACDACTATLACPVSLALLDHPAVVAAYHEYGVDVRDRALWTVGVDWRERVLSTDPWCVRATLHDPTDDGDDGDPRPVLAAYVGRDCTVVDTDRLDDTDRSSDADPAAGADRTAGAEPASGTDRADATGGEADAITVDADDGGDDAPAEDGTPA